MFVDDSSHDASAADIFPFRLGVSAAERFVVHTSAALRTASRA
jgi:hypothetical protein